MHRNKLALYLTVAVLAVMCVLGVTGMCVLGVTGCTWLQEQRIKINAPNPLEEDPSCTIYADMGITGGVIHKYIKNPCAAQNLLATIAKTGVALEAYQIKDFEVWAGEAKKYLAVGMTFDTVKLYIGSELTKFNTKVGAVYFVISDLMLVLPDKALVENDDLTLLNASIDDLVKRVKQMAILFGNLTPEQRNLIRQELGCTLWGWKDPRTCLTLWYWLKAIECMEQTGANWHPALTRFNISF